MQHDLDWASMTVSSSSIKESPRWSLVLEFVPLSNSSHVFTKVGLCDERLPDGCMSLQRSQVHIELLSGSSPYITHSGGSELPYC